MKTTLSKITLIIFSVISFSSNAANIKDPSQTHTTFVGDGNTSTLTGNWGDYSSRDVSGRVDVVGYNNSITDTSTSTIIGSSNIINRSDVNSLGEGNKADNMYGNIIGDNNQISNGISNIYGNGSVINGDKNDGVGNQVSIEGEKNVSLGSSSSVNANNSVSIGYASTNTRDNTISFGSSGNERQLTNVAAGTSDTDVTNLKQMNDADAAMLENAKGYTDSQVSAEQQARVDGDAATLNNAKSYTDTRETVINQRTDSLITSEQQSRINGDAATLNRAKSYADDGDRRTLNSANSYTNQKFSEMGKRVSSLDNKVNRNERRANSGIAGAMAMSSIPYLNYVNSGFGMATGTYRGETSIAAGFQQQLSASTNVRVNMSWDTSDGVGVGAGFAVGW